LAHPVVRVVFSFSQNPFHITAGPASFTSGPFFYLKRVLSKSFFTVQSLPRPPLPFKPHFSPNFSFFHPLAELFVYLRRPFVPSNSFSLSFSFSPPCGCPTPPTKKQVYFFTFTQRFFCGTGGCFSTPWFLLGPPNKLFLGGNCLVGNWFFLSLFVSCRVWMVLPNGFGFLRATTQPSLTQGF